VKSNGKPEKAIFNVTRRVMGQTQRDRHFLLHITSPESIESYRVTLSCCAYA